MQRSWRSKEGGNGDPKRRGWEINCRLVRGRPPDCQRNPRYPALWQGGPRLESFLHARQKTGRSTGPTVRQRYSMQQLLVSWRAVTCAANSAAESLWCGRGHAYAGELRQFEFFTTKLSTGLPSRLMQRSKAETCYLRGRMGRSSDRVAACPEPHGVRRRPSAGRG